MRIKKRFAVIIMLAIGLQMNKGAHSATSEQMEKDIEYLKGKVQDGGNRKV